MDIGALIRQITDVYHKINKKQKIAIFATLFAVIGFLAYLIVFSTNRGNGNMDGYSVLFEGVNPSDSAAIIQHLKQNNIPYELQKEDTILIPTPQVYEQRIVLASQGIPKNSKIGFEIFDTKDFGATDFDQKIKFLRATEGELSRTIEALTPIESAIVRIALPKESVFVSKATPPTASVVLKMKKNMVLSPTQVMGIKNLVSSAVTSLVPDNVKIVDENGEPLEENPEEANSREIAKLLSMQTRYQQNYEKSLEEKVINLLAPIVGGKDRVVARITAEFDFRQIKSTQEIFDPNSVVRSEQSLEERKEGVSEREVGGVPGAVSNIGPVQEMDNTGKEKYEKSTSTINYEIGKTISEVRGEFGVLKRLSVAVAVDGKYEKVEENGVQKMQYVPLPQATMTKIDALVKQAVGFNSARGDNVEVGNFELNPIVLATQSQDKLETFKNDFEKILSPLLPILKYLIVLIIAFVFYRKVIAPFVDKMLANPQEDDEILESMLQNEEVKESDTRLSEMRKRVEEELAGQDIFNEEDVKYDVLVERMRDLITEKPQEIASLCQKLILDELDVESNSLTSNKQENPK